MTVQADNPESIALVSSEGILPIAADDSNRSRYFSLRVLGFTKQEARELTPIKERSVFYWYEDDANFKRLDNEDIREARDKFAPDAVGVEFSRNLALYMMYDRKILEKALKVVEGVIKDKDFTSHEKAYLRGARSHYTPDGLVKMMRAIKGETGGSGDTYITYQQMVMKIAREDDAETILEYGKFESGQAEKLFESQYLKQGSEAAQAQ